MRVTRVCENIPRTYPRPVCRVFIRRGGLWRDGRVGRAVTRVFEVIRALKKTISQGAHTRPKHETIFGIRINTHTSVLRVCEDSLFTGPTLLC